MSVIGNAIIVGNNGVDTSDANATAADILSGKTAYVNGSKVTGNIEVFSPSPYVPPVTMISFRVVFQDYSTSYQAEDGMTWGEWCNSEYNPGDYFVSGNEIRLWQGVIENAHPTDLIKTNIDYSFYSGGGGSVIQ